MKHTLLTALFVAALAATGRGRDELKMTACVHPADGGAVSRRAAQTPAQAERAPEADDEGPPLDYLRKDYRAVRAVAHVRACRAEIVGRIGGYENWKVSCEVAESFKGPPRKGGTIEYFQGADAGLRREYFAGDKIVFLLSEYERWRRARRYSALENSTLTYTAERARKLRVVRDSLSRRRPRR